MSTLLQRTAFVAALTLAVTLGVHGQGTDREIQYRLAKGFEQSGDWEKAAGLYENLLNAEPKNYVYFEGLRQCYTNLKEYDKAIDLIGRRLVMQPEDPSLLSQLAGVYYQMGRRASADSLWSLVIQRNRTNSGVYRLVATQMIEFRLYEEAIAVYREGRNTSVNPVLYADELASLYSALLQFEPATREYIGILSTRPQQLPYVETRLGQFTSRPDGLRAALSVTRQEVERSPGDSQLHALLAWLEMEDRDYESALGEYRIVDRLNKANGLEVFNFAQRAAREGVPRVAAEAFRDVIENTGAASLKPRAQFGYARALEEISADTSLPTSTQEVSLASTWPVSEARPTPAGVILLYRSIAAAYPNSDVAAQALDRIGHLERERLNDLDAALAAFEQVRRIPAARNLVIEAAFEIGDIQIARNDLKRARAEFTPLSFHSVAEIRDRALFRIAELDYFEAQFDTALALFSGLTANVNSDLANDALGYEYFLRENKEANIVGLTAFSHADLLMRQQRSAEALTEFQSIRLRFPNALLIDDVMMRLGKLFLELQQPDSALVVYELVADSLSSSIFKDRAQLHIGELYDQVWHNKDLAIAAYEKLLTVYPNSLYADEVRKRIRVLRGDVL